MKKDESIIFCLDTSVFVDVNRFLIKLIPNLFREFDNLFNSGRIISHKIVYEEITAHSKKPDSLTKWIKSKENFFKEINLQQTLLVADIVQKFPTLIHFNKEKDDADPWLVAMILELRATPDLFSILNEYVIVSTESEHIPNRLPDVCKYYSIRHFDLDKFFSAVGWSISLQTE